MPSCPRPRPLRPPTPPHAAPAHTAPRPPHRPRPLRPPTPPHARRPRPHRPPAPHTPSHARAWGGRSGRGRRPLKQCSNTVWGGRRTRDVEDWGGVGRAQRARPPPLPTPPHTPHTPPPPNPPRRVFSAPCTMLENCFKGFNACPAARVHALPRPHPPPPPTPPPTPHSWGRGGGRGTYGGLGRREKQPFVISLTPTAGVGGQADEVLIIGANTHCVDVLLNAIERNSAHSSLALFWGKCVNLTANKRQYSVKFWDSVQLRVRWWRQKDRLHTLEPC